MDFQVPSAIIFTFICILFAFLKSNFKKSSKKLPPGPWKLPLVGNIHQFGNGSHPHHTLRDLAKKYGPIMHLQLGQTSNVVVSSPEMAKEIMKTHDAIFANRPHLLATDIFTYNATDIVFAPYGSYWRQLRKICTLELLTAKRVQSFRFIREEEVSALVKNISESEGSIVNFSKKISSLSNDIICRAAFGKKSEDREAFLMCLENQVKLIEGFTFVDLFPSIKVLQTISGMRVKIEKVHKELDRILENVIREHKEKKVSQTDEEQDILDVLLKIQQQNDLEFPLTHDNIKAVVLDVFNGGTDTSSTTVEWTMAELMKHQEVMKKVQSEVREVYKNKGFVDESELHQLKYMKCVIKESLRLHPPAPLLAPRENSETCVINGYEIPAKTKVIVNAWAVARDPKYWSEPENFQPERFLDSSVDFKGTDFELIPFGAGRRICPGMTFATPNVELPLASMLYHFDWKLPNGLKNEELDMTEAFGAAVRRKGSLLLIPIRYKP